MQAFPSIFVNVSIVVFGVGLVELGDVTIVDKVLPINGVMAEVPKGSGNRKCRVEVLSGGADKAMVAKETVRVDDICQSADVVCSCGEKHQIELNAKPGIMPCKNKGGLAGI